jgi:spore maturation protein CgeB
VTPHPSPLRIVIAGLSITSSWGNGHATTYRALVRALTERGHHVLFLERDVEWYASHRDLPDPPYAHTALYASLDELQVRFRQDVQQADCVIVGSYVPEGRAVGDWVLDTAEGVTAFYDIDTPVTLASLERGTDAEYIAAAQIPRYQLYLSFSGGPALDRLECVHGAPRARPLYCSYDPRCYYPMPMEPRWDLGYMGTYSSDRQPGLQRLLVDAARQLPGSRFAVAGASYPASVRWPANVEYIEHLPQSAHRAFYTAQRFTLNLTRAEMVRLGHSPSVRLFEAAACGTPIISDAWEGLDAFFTPGAELLLASSVDDTLRHLRDVREDERRAIGQRARQRVLGAHTPQHRAQELEAYIAEAANGREERAS